MLERRNRKQSTSLGRSLAAPVPMLPPPPSLEISNFRLFSTDNTASDAHGRNSLASNTYPKLAVSNGEEQENSIGSGSDPIPDKETTRNDHGSHARKEEKEKDSYELQILNSQISGTYYSRQIRGDKKENVHSEDDNRSLDSARSSFSVAIKGTQPDPVLSVESLDWIDSSEARLRKLDGRRRSSLDLNSVSVYSPRSSAMKKNVVSSRWHDPFRDTGALDSRLANVRMQRGWSSERVPSASRKSVSSASVALNNGRTLPSKWEDAERWIFSPASGDSVNSSSLPPTQRRTKSKSGPLGPPGESFHSLHSPATLMFEGDNAGHFIVDSPFSAGVMSNDGLAFNSRGHGNGRIGPCMTRSVSLHTFSRNQSTFTVLQAGNLDVSNKGVSRRTIAAQITPEDNASSTPGSRPSTSASSPFTLSIVALKNMRSSKIEVKDVEIDKQVTMKSKADGWLGKDEDVDSESCALDISDTTKSILKFAREEAKITAWENLQKAKAEASIRKLEMKLEKKRSSSMDKIMKKLRSSQRRGQEMRSSILVSKVVSHKATSFCRARQKGSLSGCFTCYAI